MIWYFTGTGQCRHLAENIAEGLIKAGHEVQMTDITPYDVRNDQKDKLNGEQIIFVFPVYASDMPVPLKDYLRGLRTDRTKILLIAVWGNAHKGKALYNAWKILLDEGFIINGAAEIVAEHSYLHQQLPINGERPTYQEKQELLEYIRKQLPNEESIKLISNKDHLLIKLLCVLPQGTVPKLVVKIDFQQDRCNRCGICIKTCPTGAIRDNFTVDKKRCIMCLSCITNCKKGARKYHMKKIATRALKHHQKIRNGNIFYG